MLKDIPYHGRFGAIRKYDIHTGLDLYCEDGDSFYAFEDGEIINIFNFTGDLAESPWWENTKGILIRSDKFSLLYGEVETELNIGDFVKKGDRIGSVKRVLKEDKGLPMCMLHIEAYNIDYFGEGVIWNLNEDKPDMLLNIEDIINI